jgi:hypothetical protein
MLFPDQRIGCHREKIIPIFTPEWAKLDELPF